MYASSAIMAPEDIARMENHDMAGYTCQGQSWCNIGPGPINHNYPIKVENTYCAHYTDTDSDASQCSLLDMDSSSAYAEVDGVQYEYDPTEEFPEQFNNKDQSLTPYPYVWPYDETFFYPEENLPYCSYDGSYNIKKEPVELLPCCLGDKTHEVAPYEVLSYSLYNQEQHRSRTFSTDSCVSSDHSDDSSFQERKEVTTRKRKPVNSKRRKEDRVKNVQLWQFLRIILSDERYNPQLIVWVSEEEGIFKFVQSKKVAQLWGQRKQRDRMPYEHLSRAMRHYYKRGILRRIVCRRLTYQFGPNAKGWREGFNDKDLCKKKDK